MEMEKIDDLLGDEIEESGNQDRDAEFERELWLDGLE